MQCTLFVVESQAISAGRKDRGSSHPPALGVLPMVTSTHLSLRFTLYAVVFFL